MTPTRLVLFDIDGTLIRTNGIARSCFADALDEVFGGSTIARTHDFAGKTDLQIYTEVMTGSGYDAATCARWREPVFAKFFALLSSRLSADDITVLPGIRELLPTLQAHPDVVLGLLTGNMPQGARIKLHPVGLFDFFPFGAFGSDSPHRHDLPAIAVQRAKAVTGITFSGSQIVIIGDTPHDITCGRGVGARSLAVATGTVSRATLAKEHPDALFSDLSNIPAVIEAILTPL